MYCLYYNYLMAKSDRVVTFRPDGDILQAMELLKDRDGVPYSQQIRRALREWLESKGVLAKKDSARRRSLQNRTRGRAR